MIETETADPGLARFNRSPDPTPAEIREMCRQIQATWSPREERERRVGGPPKRWLPPGCNVHQAGVAVPDFVDVTDEG